MKVLVSGANGYLGKGIVDHLIDNGADVIATDFITEKVNRKAKRIDSDIFCVQDPFHFFDEPDIFLHLAWRDGFNHNSVNHFKDLSNHIALLERFFKSDIKKISVMGSMHEIGFHEGSINEFTKTEPMSYYGISKDSLRRYTRLMAEKYVKNYQWLRAFYVVGNASEGSSIFSKLILAEKEKKKVFPFTTGNNQYDFLNYEDFSDMVAKTVIQDEVNGIINICSGKPTKLSERVEKFIEENNLTIKLKYGAFPDREYDSKAIWGDSKKIDIIMGNE
ncbi:NAD-dependent epimerase/dehydratase family protein [Enterococcus sp. AZ007]|uniref:NAD-dependent epimerase/dehydratase family protein n=1 Tax=Enterococcus sp. AZ007 TaxID=2774839 RepID=UPI003F224FF9